MKSLIRPASESLAPAGLTGGRDVVPLRILIIDDDPTTRLLARAALSRAGGHSVVEAPDGASGVDAAISGRPDVILLDHNMPGLSGPETLERLQAEVATAHIPVVFLTGRDDPGLSDRLQRAGAVGVLVKPFNPATLARQLVSLLEARSG